MQNKLLRWWYLHQRSVSACLAGVSATFMFQNIVRGEYGSALIELLVVLLNLLGAGMLRIR